MTTDGNLDKNIIPNEKENKFDSLFINTGEEQKKPLSYLELILKYKNKININYSEYDFQKGESSPRLLFKKRKSDSNECLGYSSSKISKLVINRGILDNRNGVTASASNSQSVNAPAATQIQSNGNTNMSLNNPTNTDSSSNLSITIVANSVNNVSSNSVRNGSVNLVNNNNNNNFPNTTATLGGNKSREKESIDNLYNQIEEKFSITQNNKIFKVVHENIEQKQSNSIKSTFENYLDVVHDSYFSQEESNRKDNINTNINFNSAGMNNHGEDQLCAEEDNSSLTNNNSSFVNKNSDKKLINSNQPAFTNHASSNLFNIFNVGNGSSSPNLFKFSSLDLLLNPLRQKYIWETWSPYEVALFECCICKFGKNFDIYPKIVNIYLFKILIYLKFNYYFI